jgi:signal transduction histidine kinase
MKGILVCSEYFSQIMEKPSKLNLDLPSDNYYRESPKYAIEGQDSPHQIRRKSLPELNLKSPMSSRRSSMRNPLEFPNAASFDSSEGETDDVVFGFGLGLTPKQLRTVFPHHIVINEDFNIIQMGSKLSTFMRHNTDIKHLNYEHIGKYFRISSPNGLPWDWTQLFALNDQQIELELVKDYLSSAPISSSILTISSSNNIENMTTFSCGSGGDVGLDLTDIKDSSGNSVSPTNAHRTTFNFILRGSFLIVNPKENPDVPSFRCILFLHPHVETEVDLRFWKLKMQDVSPHGYQKPYIALADKIRVLEDAFDRINLDKEFLEKEIIRLNEEAASKAKELRHMIANVAHDLKTPLAAFLGGAEIVDHEADETLKILKQSPNQQLLNQKLSTTTSAGAHGSTSPKTEEQQHANLINHVETISVNVKHMRDINSFMTMTINRCLEFTKASQGLKLMPKNETINLAETILLPLKVMQSIQSKVTISLLPMDEGICTHVITDKQWLQENVLCLLSNAVKYSHRGMITVSMYLHTLNAWDYADCSLNLTEKQLFFF